MYLPKHFQVSDPGILKSFMKENSFATLVSTGAGGLNANHYPFLSMEEDGKTVLFFHLARANQQWKELEANPDCLVIFQGPHDYISPTLYKNPLNAPTWNYTAVHANCKATLIQDKEHENVLMEMLVNVYESKQKTPWPNQLPEDYREKLMKAIVWVKLEVIRLEGKFKLSQNRELNDYLGVLEGTHDIELLKYMKLTRKL